MELKITGHQMDATAALKTFTNEKFAKLERHFDKIISADIVFNVEKTRQIAEAKLNVPQGQINAHAETDDMYATVEKLVDKLDRLIIKHKEKLRSHRA